MKTENKVIIDHDRIIFYCPGCEGHHSIVVCGSQHWTWNRDKVKPTFSPSVRVRGTGQCHFYVEDGKIQYLSDSTHKLAGKTIDMEPIDENYDKTNIS